MLFRSKPDIDYYCVYRLSQILGSLVSSGSKIKENSNPNPFSTKLQSRLKSSLNVNQPRGYIPSTETCHKSLRHINLCNETPEVFPSSNFNANIEQFNPMFENGIDPEVDQEDDYSNAENEEQLMQVVMENSKNIQMMQQFVMQLTQQLMEIKGATQTDSICYNDEMAPDKNSQNHFSGLDSITNNEGKITFSLDASNIDSKQSLEENIKEEINLQEEPYTKNEYTKKDEEDDIVLQDTSNELNHHRIDEFNPHSKEQDSSDNNSICIPRIINPLDGELGNYNQSIYSNKILQTNKINETCDKNHPSYIDVRICIIA